MSLKKKIHNSLLVEKETKNQSLIIESKIINSHLSTLKNCEDIDCVVENLIKKTYTFKKKNFSDKLIKEGVFDILQSLFGDLDDNFWNDVKDRFSDHILINLKIDEGSKDCVKEKLMAVPNEEVSKMMSDADFVSDKVSEAYVECFQNTILKSGVDQELGTAGTELRNAITSLLNDQGFIQNLSGKISSQISDTLSKIQQKDEKIAGEIKTAVMGGNL